MKDKYNVGLWFVIICVITLSSGCSPTWSRSQTAKKQLSEQKEMNIQLTRIADAMEKHNATHKADF